MNYLSGVRRIIAILVILIVSDGFAQEHGVGGGVQDIYNIVPRRERREIKREILEWSICSRQ